MRPLLDALLSTDRLMRARLAQAGVAMLTLAAGVLAMHYFVLAGVAPAAPVAWWSALSLAGMLVFYALIRSGWSRRLADASMAVPQMIYAVTCAALAYGLLGPGRGGVFLIVMVVLMFGMFVATPQQMRSVSLYAVACFGAVMALLAWRQPLRYPPSVELGHFLIVATMMPAVSMLAARLCRMRQRSRQQRADLAQALARIRELATRDELTGLINRRHVQELLEQEHQRCIRSGQTFCLVLLDIDQFKTVNETYGQAAGDAVLQAVAREALREVRVSDVLARWGGEEFVLMLPDTRAVMARGGLDRLLARVAALRSVPLNQAGGADLVLGAPLTMAAGMAEHIAGETVAQTRERAKQALAEAKALGRGSVVTAA